MDEWARILRGEASSYARAALTSIKREFPSGIYHTMKAPGDFPYRPRARTPAFYGSFDWHSCVHGYWLLASLLRREPGIPEGGAIRELFNEAFTAETVAGEVAYLARPSSRGFERPYGWGWLLKLQAELMAHDAYSKHVASQ